MVELRHQVQKSVMNLKAIFSRESAVHFMRSLFMLSVVSFLPLALNAQEAEELATLSSLWKTGELWEQNQKTIKARALDMVKTIPVDVFTCRTERGVTFGDVDLCNATWTWKDPHATKDAAKAAKKEDKKADEKDVQTDEFLLRKVVCILYDKAELDSIPEDASDAEKKNIRKRYLKEFTDLSDKIIKDLDKETGIKGKPVKLPGKEVGTKTRVVVWQGEKGILLLEAATSGKNKERMPEYIRLSIAPSLTELEKGGAADAAAKKTLKSRLTKTDDGLVYIDGIPMIDQGDKGYCVPASVARVFAAYGMDSVDMYKMAAACKSSGKGGTSWDDMEKALLEIGRTYHVKMIIMMQVDPASWLKDYNRQAKKADKDQIENFSDEELKKIDPKALLAARSSKSSDVKKWFSMVSKTVDDGMPILWATISGLYNDGTSVGGHMRLIIGYNSEKDQIIYTDSWGAGHERKEISAKEAYAMTKSLYILRPNK